MVKGATELLQTKPRSRKKRVDATRRDRGYAEYATKDGRVVKGVGGEGPNVRRGNATEV